MNEKSERCNDFVEISSDSSDTIIHPLTNDLPESESLFMNYGSDSRKTSTEITTSNEKEDICDKEILERLYKKYVKPSSSSITSNHSVDSNPIIVNNDLKGDLVVLSDSSDEASNKNLHSSNDSGKVASDESNLDKVVKKRNKKISASPQKKQRKEQKILKQLEKANKKMQLEKQRALKETVKRIQKSIKPEECMKNIIVKIDESVLVADYGDSITSNLKSNGISYKSSSTISGLISWSRKIQTIENLFSGVAESNEKHVFLILSSKEFKKHVRDGSLLNHIQFVNEKVQFHHISIAVFGLGKPSEDEESVITEVELFFKCYWQFVVQTEDLASLVMMLTKSVAQIPYKLDKQEKYELQSQFFDVVNKDTVRVDKNGNGLARAWPQMLTMFPNARLETAEAITAVFSTPSSLFKAYSDNSVKGEEMIQDLPIRRANGPLTAVRKIGPELSKKCYKFFTSEENILL